MVTDKVTYLYIDDEYDFAESCSQEIERSDPRVSIECKTPDSFDEEIENFEMSLDSYDGLILDWKLDLIPSQKRERGAFRAGALAQEIRTRGSERTEGKEKGLKELPVVIWSVQSKLERSFYGDSSSSDLFDAVYDKDYLVDGASRVASELVALVEGYRHIAGTRANGFLSVVGATPKQAQYLDPRFTKYLDQLTEASGPSSTHDFAKFLMKEVIAVSGPLVDEQLLAARLGVRHDDPSWNGLLGVLSGDMDYTGPFHQAWPRWWWPVVERDWWASLFEKERAPKLSTLTAPERVGILKTKTGIAELVPAEPIKPIYNQRFYTVCAITGQPLDPVDGVMLGGREPLPWQDARYISIDAALEGLYRDRHWSLHPSEEERVKTLRKGGP